MRFNERLKLKFCAVLISAMIVFSFACGGGSGNGGNGDEEPPSTYSISGHVTTDGTGLSGVTMTLSETSIGTATTDSNGNYSFASLSNGSYTVTPSLSGCLFDPSYRDVTISGASETAVDFVAEPGASEVIGSAGGTVEVTNPSSPLYGIKVEVPSEALDTDSTISIETTTSSPSYNTGSRASSPIFELESPDASYFNIPVTVTVPYEESLVDDERYIGLFIYNSSTDSWQSTTTGEIDTLNNTISATTMHFSIFQVISLLLDSTGVDIDTDFRPYVNGFDIINTGGWCYGMSAYSKWFFLNKSPGTLYGFYDNLTAKGVAAESQLKVTDIVNGLLLGLDLIPNAVFNVYDYLYGALSITGKPQLILMYEFSPFMGHMVVAYAVYDGKVYIYDNNHPGEELFLTPNNFGGFLKYKDYTIFLLVGASCFFEDFEDIYDEYLPDIYVDNPVAYYPFNGNANDESGTGNHGTVHGASLTTDRFGNSNSAYEFDGSDDYIEVPDSDSLDITHEITIIAWVKPDVNYVISPVVEKYRSELGYRAYWLRSYSMGTFGPRFRVYTTQGIGDANTTDLLSTTNWSLLVGTYDGTNAKLYINSELKNTNSGPGSIYTNNLPLRIGATNESSVAYFDGKIDDVRIYNRVLSASEIQTLYMESIWH